MHRPAQRSRAPCTSAIPQPTSIHFSSAPYHEAACMARSIPNTCHARPDGPPRKRARASPVHPCEQSRNRRSSGRRRRHGDRTCPATRQVLAARRERPGCASRRREVFCPQARSPSHGPRRGEPEAVERTRQQAIILDRSVPAPLRVASPGANDALLRKTDDLSRSARVPFMRKREAREHLPTLWTGVGGAIVLLQ